MLTEYMQAKLTMMMSPARTIAQLPPIIAPAILQGAQAAAAMF
jgi:hypothetical protein